MAKKEHVYNKFFTPEKWEKVNPLNKAVREDYTLELRQNQKAKGTIDGYRNDWRIIFIVILERFDNKCILELTRKHWRDLSLYFTTTCEHSNSRVNRLMSAQRSMMSFVEEDDDYDYDFSTCSKVKGLRKEPVRDIIFLSNEQIFKLKDELMKREEYQKLLLLFLGYDSGGRKNELFQVKKSVFDNAYPQSTNEVLGKRGKKFELVYFDETIKVAQLYLQQRGEDDFEELWTLGKGNKRRPCRDAERLYDWAKDMNTILEGIEGKPIGFNVHSLRHSCTDNLSTGNPTHYALALPYINRPEGYSILELKLHLNHSDVSTTQGYVQDRSQEEKLSMFGLDKPHSENTTEEKGKEE